MNVYSVCVKYVGFLLMVLLPVYSWAEEKKLTPPDPLASGGRVMIFLVFILALIVVLAWMVHKTRVLGGMQGMPGSNQSLRIVATLSLGMKEKIVVIQAGDQQFMVGITAQQITLLSELEKPLPVGENARLSFQELLKKAVRT